MRHQTASLIDNLITVIIIAVASLTPLILSNLTTEFYEGPKLIALTGTTLILLLLWSISWVIKGKVLITRTPIDLPILMLIIIVILSAFFSSSRFPSIYGSLPRVHGSAVAWITYLIFFFVTVSHLRSMLQIKNLLYGLLASGTVIAIISLLSFFGLYLPLPFSQFANFTPTGSAFSTLSILILLLPTLLTSIITPSKFLPQIAATAIASLFIVTIALLGNTTLYIITAFIIFLTLFFSNRILFKRALPYLGVVIGLALVALLISRVPLGDKNIIQQKRANFPQEVQLTFSSSWKVAVSAFRDAPFLGTGPSTFLYDFTQYKSAEQNNSRFWNVRFDSAYNEFLQVLATLGSLGLLSLVFLVAIILNFSIRNLNLTHINTQESEGSEFFKIAAFSLAIAGIASVLLLSVHSATLVSLVTTLVILAMLMATHKQFRNKVQEISLGIKTSSFSPNSNLITGDALPIIILLPMIIFVVYVFWNMAFVVRADYHHRVALNSATTKGIDTYNNLILAERFNPRIDLYRVDLAQTNFALANAIAAQKGPTEASPGGSLTDEDKRTIRQLLSQSISEGRAAVTLNPRNPQNWEILAGIYRQISGVAKDALTFSLDAYGKAIQRDPLNPQLRLAVGGVYYSVKNYDLAIRFFSDAINLKPDFANAYYNLSVALRDKGDLKNAQASAERVIQLLQADTGSNDYKTAAAFLEDLKARIATGSAQSQETLPPAAQENAALQKKNLPAVEIDELKDKPEVATPAAVKKNPKALELQSSPSPTPEN